MKALPDFRDPDFLRDQALRTMALQDRRASAGPPHSRELVDSARGVLMNAWAASRFPAHEQAPAWRKAVEQGVRELQRIHRDPATGGYAWRVAVDDQGRTTVIDGTQRAAGLACVLRAHAHALMAGVDSAADGLHDAFKLLERHFWEPAQGLYADEASMDWRLSPYRSQNANIQACEALLAADQASGETPYLARAVTVAESLVQRLAATSGGLVREHYSVDWTPDAEGARDDGRTRGYQTGHLARWARLVLALERAQPSLPDDNWLQHRSRQLFSAAVERGWDRTHGGGLICSFAPDGAVCDGGKLAWVQAEAIGAAAALAERTGEGGYWDWYDRIWGWAWEHLVDPASGEWQAALVPGTAAGPPDFHVLGACCEALDALERQPVVRA